MAWRRQRRRHRQQQVFQSSVERQLPNRICRQNSCWQRSRRDNPARSRLGQKLLLHQPESCPRPRLPQNPKQRTRATNIASAWFSNDRGRMTIAEPMPGKMTAVVGIGASVVLDASSFVARPPSSATRPSFAFFGTVHPACMCVAGQFTTGSCEGVDQFRHQQGLDTSTPMQNGLKKKFGQQTRSKK